MSRIKVTNRFEGSDPATGYGAVVELDGRELPYVRSTQFGEISSDQILTAKIEVLASEAFEVDLDAQVTVEIHAFRGCKIVESIGEDGRKTYICVPTDFQPLPKPIVGEVPA